VRLTIERLTFSRSGRAVLQDIALTGESGQMLCLMGSNGAGKTTLLRLLLGLLRPDKGRILLDGDDLHHLGRRAHARLMAYVPQRHDLPPPYGVAEIVRLGRLPHTGLTGALSPEDEKAVAQAMTQLDLSALQHRPCTSLSGGEYQRVLLARALAQDTPVLVLDEPLAGLDYGHQLRLMRLLSDLVKKGRLVVMTAHQPDLVYRHASQVVLLQMGRILAQGTPPAVLDASRLSAFYGVSLDQYDHGPARFFAGGEDWT